MYFRQVNLLFIKSGDFRATNYTGILSYLRTSIPVYQSYTYIQNYRFDVQFNVKLNSILLILKTLRTYDNDKQLYLDTNYNWILICNFYFYSSYIHSQFVFLLQIISRKKLYDLQFGLRYQIEFTCSPSHVQIRSSFTSLKLGTRIEEVLIRWKGGINEFTGFQESFASLKLKSNQFHSRNTSSSQSVFRRKDLSPSAKDSHFSVYISLSVVRRNECKIETTVILTNSITNLSRKKRTFYQICLNLQKKFWQVCTACSGVDFEALNALSERYV